MRMPATAFVYLFGPGIWRWRVRAEFPKTSGFVTGPWSSYVPFTRTLGEPSGATTSVSGNHVLLSWNWKLGAKDFDVQISQRPRLRDDDRGRDDGQHELRAAAPTLLLRQRRLVLLARGRPGQELQRRRLDAAAADRHLSATASGRQYGPLLAAAGVASSSPCPIQWGRLLRAPPSVSLAPGCGRSRVVRMGAARSPSVSAPRSAESFCSARQSRDSLRAPCRCASGRALRSGAWTRP